jgi:hypothetical protein
LDRQPHRSRFAGAGRTVWTWAWLGALALLAFAFHAAVPTNHDVAWILEGAGRLLDGARFGRDIVDVNPPLAWWIATLPVGFARAIGVGPGIASALFVVVLALASVGLADAAASWGETPPRERAMQALAAGAFLLLAPGYDFAQREHLMLIAAWPYLTAAGVRAQGHRLPVPLAGAIGLLSALGFYQKPYFLLVPLLVEIWIARAQGVRQWVRPETGTLAAVGFGYLGAVLVFAPDYLFGNMPDAIAGYWAYQQPVSNVVARAALALAPLAFAAGLLRRGLGDEPVPALAPILMLASAGACLSALLQAKSWSYHLVPAIGFAFMGCVVLYAASGGGVRRQPLAAAAVVLIAAAGFGPALRDLGERALGRETDRIERLAALFRSHAGETGSVFAFVTSPRDVHPAVLASGARWMGSACCLHLLPAAMRADEIGPDAAARAREAASRQVAAVVAGMAAERPAVVVVDAHQDKLGFRDHDFDYVAHLSKDARFAALWADYVEHEPIDGFRVFLRRDPLARAVEHDRARDRRDPS